MRVSVWSAGTHDQNPTIFVDTSMVFVIRPVYVLRSIEGGASPQLPAMRDRRRAQLTGSAARQDGAHLLPML